MSDDLPFKAEYAKSGRSSCKACKGTISKDSLRLAKMVQSPHFDGKMPLWFHVSCFFKKNTISSQGDVGGFDSLRWDDQQLLKQRISGTGGAVGGSVQASKAGPEKVFERADLQVEYAKSNRSTCRACWDTIAMGEVRIAKMEEPDEDETYAFGQLIARWHHVDCFLEKKSDLHEEITADMLTGYKRMKKPDQEMLSKKFGGAPSIKKGTKRKKGADVTDGPPAKKTRSPEEEEEEKKLKEQSEFVWKIRDKLRDQVTNNGLRELLEANGQQVPSGESRLLDRVSDCMAFGSLEHCPTCSYGQLVLSGDQYSCTGNLTEWTKCQYSTLEPKRSKFIIPKDMLDIDYLKTFKFKKRERIFPKVTAIPQTTAVASTADARPSDKPLQGCKIAFIGRMKGKGDLEGRIKELGGTVSTKVDDALFCCISTEAEVKKKSKKIVEAELADVPVVADSFVEDAAGGAAELKIYAHKLASWGLKRANTKSSGASGSAKSSKPRATDDVDGPVKKMTVSVKGGAAVDPESGLESNCHVVEEKGSIYSATLGMVDIQRGTNSYYKLQLLETDKGSRWYVFRSWGRVGTTIGGHKEEPFASRANAKAHFLSLYEEKTGTCWELRKSSPKVPGKFYPLEIDYGQDDEEVQKFKTKVEAGSCSKLPQEVQDLVRMLFDVESMQKALVEFEIDLKKMPLGKLSRRQIENAYKVLNEAQQELSGRNDPTHLLDASNRFYTLIPHDFGMQKPPLLDNNELILSKCQMLDSLLEIEVAYSLLKESGGNDVDDPLDINYRKLKTEMQPMDHGSEEFQMLREFTKNTHGKTHTQYELDILEAFKIERQGEAKRYKPFSKLNNRMLLWHGSRMTNFVGILSQGLRIAPPEAPVTGYMFGKGVYFADMVSKSANYCHASASGNTGLMLLCEVALGDMYELTSSEFVTKLPAGKHSTKGCGKTAPDPSGFQTLGNGCLVPMGEGKDSSIGYSSLLYNEFIVYDVAQIRMKYLLKMDFKYKSSWW